MAGLDTQTWADLADMLSLQQQKGLGFVPMLGLFQGTRGVPPLPACAPVPSSPSLPITDRPQGTTWINHRSAASRTVSAFTI